MKTLLTSRAYPTSDDDPSKWCAYYWDGWIVGALYGWGSTEEEAIADLKSKTPEPAVTYDPFGAVMTNEYPE